MTQLNDTTRRYPRTLNEAFGPYADRTQLYVEEDVLAFEKEDRIVMIACGVASLAMLVIGLLAWI